MDAELTTPQFILIIGGAMVLSAILGAITASLKTRNADAWGFACFVFPPLFFVLLLLPKGNYVPRKKLSRADLDEDLKDDIF